MARFFPPREVFCVDSELKVRQALCALTDDWIVFHSVTWQSLRNGRQGDGEADFVLLNKNHGLAVLEVKGGGVSVEDGNWLSSDRNGIKNEIKNPFEQAKVNKYALIRYLDGLMLGEKVPVCHCVAFPDIRVTSSFGMYGPREIVLDRSNLLTIDSSVRSVFNHWGQSASLSPHSIRMLTQALAPTVAVRPLLRERIEDVENKIVNLTDQQILTFRNLRKLRRALVTGSAGTGKTLLAINRALQLEAEGFETLFLCFNSLLAEHLRSVIPRSSNLSVNTFHQFCLSQCNKAKLPVAEDRAADWWETTAAELLIQACSTNNVPYDAVVIDEAQDFAEAWLLAIYMLPQMAQDSPLYIFADAEQELYRRGWNAPDDVPQIVLDINCRNTKQIYERFVNLIPGESLSVGPDGQAPIFIRSNGTLETIPTVQQLVIELIEQEKLKPEQIVVLCDRTQTVNILRETFAGDYPFMEWGGSTGIVVETIHRFKGLEAECVIVVLSDTPPSADSFRTLCYVALSRARCMLYVIGSPKVRKALNWP